MHTFVSFELFIEHHDRQGKHIYTLHHIRLRTMLRRDECICYCIAANRVASGCVPDALDVPYKVSFAWGSIRSRWWLKATKCILQRIAFTRTMKRGM